MVEVLTMITESGKVFVVDDEHELMTALCEMLDEQGYKTKGFTSGQEALKALEGQEIDVLLSDIMMPGMDGISVLKSALEIDPNVVGIMMTGHGTIQTAVEAMKSGAFDYVLKPFKLAELLPVLDRAIEVRRLRLENIRLRETVAIYELTKALAFSLDADSILSEVAKAAVQQCEAEEGSIMLPTADGAHLSVSAIGGTERKEILGEQVAMGEGIAGWVAENRKPLLLNGEKQDPLGLSFKLGPRIRSSISTPMLAGGKLVGVLNVNNSRKHRGFTSGKVKALSILAGIGATALEAAELFARVSRAEAKYRTLVEQLPAITYVLSVDGRRPLYVSPQVETVLGIPADDWVQSLDIWSSAIHNDDRERVMEELERCLSCADRFVSDYRIVRPDKRIVWVHDEALPLHCKPGASLALQGVMVDVTHLKEAEEALKASEAMNRLLIEESPLGIGIVQHDKLVYSNPAFTKIFDYETADAIVGLSLEELVIPEQRNSIIAAQAATVTGNQVLSQVEYRGVRRSGEFFDLEAWPKSIVYLGEPVVLVFAEDITEAKSLRAQLLQAQKMEAVGTLSGGVAHDFNNILTVISGYSELVLAEKKPGDPDYEDLQKVVASAGRGTELARRLLMFSRKTEAYPHPLDLNHEIDEMGNLLIRTLPKMIHINLRLGPDLKRVNADSLQMGQLLMNLAANAKDAMPDGGELLIETRNIYLDQEYCRTHLECKPGPHVLLSVSDTGCGMEKETVGRIFEPFFTTKEPGRGTGLGLATVYGIAKQHNGYVTCYSEPGHGSVFKVYLPAFEAEATLTGAGIPAPLPAGGTETILLVDDEEFVRDLGIKLLRRSGYTVFAAANGQEALDLYERRGKDIDLVLLDLVMPGMGGKQCLKELLIIDPRVKVVISSGYSLEGRKCKTIESGAGGFVVKPFKAVELLSVIRDTLDADRGVGGSPSMGSGFSEPIDSHVGGPA
jgi:two-component system, cell cycle sensor histidine kinase and response regulator CckA